MEKTIKIHRWDNGNVIFLYTCENNTIRKTVEEAIKRGISLSYANLQYADLTCLNLSKTNLSYTNLSFANLSYRVLSGVNLSNANLIYALFIGSKLNKVNFNGANLRGTIFGYSELTDVDFTDADLRWADLYGTKITHEQLINVKGINDQCPKKGSFIGWKKCFLLNEDGDDVDEEFIVKLEIPADAKRCSATTNKCRCSKAKVLEIQKLNGSIADVDKVFSSYDNHFPYKIGETIEPDSFDDRYWIECSNGIHFFINREDAVNFKII